MKSKYKKMLTVAVILYGSLSTVCLAGVEVYAQSHAIYSTTIENGQQLIGVPVLKTAVFSSRAASSDLSGITSEYSSALVGSELVTGVDYYVEVVGGTVTGNNDHVGHRFEIDEGATITSNSTYVTVDLTSALNTVSAIPDLSGYRIEIRPHWTMNEVFPKAMFKGSNTVGAADQIHFYNGSTYEVNYLFSYSGYKFWTKTNGGLASQDGRVIGSGVGMILDREGTSPVEVVLSGAVRTNPFRQPLEAGFNLISEGFATSLSPAERGMFDSAFTGGADASLSDTASVWNGTLNGYDLYYLSDNGAGRFWRYDGTNPGGEEFSSLFFYNRAVFFNSVAGYADYRVEVPD
jgi:hypothetical protein